MSRASDSPAISVVVATRDRPALAARTLESIASQSFQDFEVVVVDDGSTIDSISAYRSLCERLGTRFRVHAAVPPQSLGSGPAAVRNRGIKAARGRYVAFLDDDDEWSRDDHLEVAYRALTASDATFFFADMQGVRGSTIAIETWYPQRPEAGQVPASPDLPSVFRLKRPALISVFRHHMIHPDCWVVDRRVLDALGGFNERLRFVEDLELGMRIVDSATAVLYRAEAIARYRLPEGDAESLKYDQITVLLQYLLAAQTIRATCRHRDVRRCARARESWTLRQIASELVSRGQKAEAASFAAQAVMTFPTLGSVHALGAVLLGSKSGHSPAL